VSHALKDIYSQIYLNNPKKYSFQSFKEGFNRCKNDKKELMNVYLNDQLRKEFRNYINSMKNMLNDNLSFVK